MSSKNPVTMNSFRIEVPSSKSEFQREVAIALLCDQPSRIRFNSLSDDSLTAIRLADELGNLRINSEFYNRFKNTQFDSYQPANAAYLQKLLSHFCIDSDLNSSENKELILQVSGTPNPNNNVINCGESGLALHLFAGILAALGGQFSLTGSGTIMNRQQKDLINSFRNIGLKVSHNDFKLPISVSGKINRTEVNLGKLVGSQALSALLLTFSKLGINAVIEVEDLKSRDYVSMTIQSLARHNIEIVNDNFKRFEIRNNQKFITADVSIEGCWSSVSFWFVLGALCGGIQIKGLNPNSLQPDITILEVLKSCGAKFRIENGTYLMDKSDFGLSSLIFDASNCPDLIPNLVILAANCEGTSVITGANRLENKESNRAEAIMQEFTKIGIFIRRDSDKFIVDKSNITAAKVHSYADHRMTMALELAARLSKKNIEIDETKNVAKSYPNFYKDLGDWDRFYPN